MADRFDGRRGDVPAASLGFDPNAILVRDPGVLLDPRFLAAMRFELETELGADRAGETLMQIGLIQGLHDAWRAVASEANGLAHTPPLAMGFACVAPDPHSGLIEVAGRWPEQIEFRAIEDPAALAPHPACHLSAGYTSGWLSGTLDADILAVEVRCGALGDAECAFVAREAEAWRLLDEPRAQALLDAIPFDALRDLVRSHVNDRTAPTPQPIDRSAACVHIWDTVMVVPFTSGDDAMQAVELLGRDPAARNVSVIVVDLAQATVDEGFGARALERVLAAAEGYGVEAIFAAVSPQAERVVADLERQPLWTHKDLAQAIASAFQIAAAQRTSV